MRVEDRLEGASNFVSWKIRIIAILEELELESYIEENLDMPNDEPQKSTWKRRNNKAKKIIIDSVKDHILPSIARLPKAYEVFETIKNTYEVNNASRMLTLKQQLLNIKMNKDDTISTYLSRISEVKDQLQTIGNEVDDQEISLIALRGLPISWESYIQCISRTPPLPKFEQLKNKCIQEESRLISRGLGPNKEGEIQALNTNTFNKKKKFSKRKRGNKNH